MTLHLWARAQRWWRQRQQRRLSIRLLVASGTLRRADQTIRYTVSEGQLDRMFPLQPGDYYRFLI